MSARIIDDDFNSKKQLVEEGRIAVFTSLTIISFSEPQLPSRF